MAGTNKAAATTSGGDTLVDFKSAQKHALTTPTSKRDEETAFMECKETRIFRMQVLPA